MSEYRRIFEACKTALVYFVCIMSEFYSFFLAIIVPNFPIKQEENRTTVRFFSCAGYCAIIFCIPLLYLKPLKTQRCSYIVCISCVFYEKLYSALLTIIHSEYTGKKTACLYYL